jgi:hypothetical protein
LSSHILYSLIPHKSAHFNATVLPDGRWLLYNSSMREAVTLTASAGILWELCDGQTSVSDLVQQLQELYPETPHSLLETEILHLLQHFLEQGIVTNSAD